MDKCCIRASGWTMFAFGVLATGLTLYLERPNRNSAESSKTPTSKASRRKK